MARADIAGGLAGMAQAGLPGTARDRIRAAIILLSSRRVEILADAVMLVVTALADLDRSG